MNINPRFSSTAAGDIEQFLLDVRDHFRASLETNEYENTSNIFHVTAAEATENLLQRCEQLLQLCSAQKHQLSQNRVNNGVNGTLISKIATATAPAVAGSKTALATADCTDSKCLVALNGHGLKEENDDAAYMDMSAATTKAKSTSREYIDFNNSADSDKTFRCSTRIGDVSDAALKVNGFGSGMDDLGHTCDIGIHNGNGMGNGNGNSNNHNVDDDDESNDDEDPRIYDICQVSQVDTDEMRKAITPELELIHALDCPFMDLPAGHLAIEKSTKYGQLQRIEKRLFFDQSKKYFCGILSNWLLCYADGPTSTRPNITLYLRNNGVEIEHFGEGKRREICFQITTADPNKKFVFQAINEVDAKEWIHAIEAAIRGDSGVAIKSARKLPTPPVLKKVSFKSSDGHGIGGSNNRANSMDYIYEEPDPCYRIEEPILYVEPSKRTERLNDPIAIAKNFEYDIPKCPPQPIKPTMATRQSAADVEPEVEVEMETETESVDLLQISDTTSTPPSAKVSQQSISPLKSATARLAEKLDFQSKVKDVHSKLSSQLFVGPKAAAKKTYSYSPSESEAIALSPPPSSLKDSSKKQKQKTTTPNGVSPPQKGHNSNNNNNNSSNNNNSNSTNNNNNNTTIHIQNSSSPANNEKSAKNWFLNRLNKTTSSVRNSSGSSSPNKCKQSSEKENLLNSLELCDPIEGTDGQNNSSNPASPILKTSGGNSNGKSKVNLIIKEFEANGHLGMGMGISMGMINVEALASNAMASLNSFCDNDCNNYEPIMHVSIPSNNFMKKL